ncbi:MAG: hypothetical protein WA488_26840, partial [Mycobacterium sp.]|uniref:hypothetical protein n=1 Tax=Mycobacterium sp. TaxID=1785 RepID=UPI003CBEE8B4
GLPAGTSAYVLMIGGGYAATHPAIVPPEQGAKLEQAWQQGTSDLIALRPQTPHVAATGSDHYVQIHQPDVVVAAVGLATQRSAPKR